MLTMALQCSWTSCADTCSDRMQSAILPRTALLRAHAHRHPFARNCSKHRHLRKQPATFRVAATAVSDILDTLQASPLVSVAIATIVLGSVATAAWGFSQASDMATGSQPGQGTSTTEVGAKSRKDAVLVFGATGRLGQEVVAELVNSGRNVVASSHKTDKVEQLYGQKGLKGAGKLFYENGVDITSKDSLMRAELWQGVSQVVTTVGPAFGRQPDGSMGYLDNMTSERVDAQGISNIAEAAKHFLPGRNQPPVVKTVLKMGSSAEMEAWEKLDDVIMGGKSGSFLQSSEKVEGFHEGYEPKGQYDYKGAVWRGELVVEGGGFCGARTKMLPDLNLQRFDGIALRVKGDGQTYKFNLKTADQMNVPESTYQAQFDTIQDEWTTVYMPWHDFVPVTRAQYDSKAKPLDPAQVKQLGLVLSRFHYNSLPNQHHKAGTFELQIANGISGYKAEVPRILMVSSAAVERNAIIGDDGEARKKDIPIVQLNPGGTLNHKYAGETAVRGSGLPYSVIRSTGITDKEEGGPFLLEAKQGDTISGNVSRPELARIVATALSTPQAAGKTVEVRRIEAADAKGKADTPAELKRLFYTSTEDRLRARIGLPPMPKPVPPPPPPSQERTKEILSDERVQRVQQREKKEREAQIASGSSSNGNGNGAKNENGAASSSEKASESKDSKTYA